MEACRRRSRKCNRHAGIATLTTQHNASAERRRKSPRWSGGVLFDKGTP